MVQLEIWNYYKHDSEKIYDEKTNMRYWHSIIMTSTSFWHLFMQVPQNISENQNEHEPESKSINCIERFGNVFIYTRQNIVLMIMHKKYLSIFQSSTRKSAILSAAKKAKLKSNPSRVRFAESVDINGSLGLTVSCLFSYCMHY